SYTSSRGPVPSTWSRVRPSNRMRPSADAVTTSGPQPAVVPWTGTWPSVQVRPPSSVRFTRASTPLVMAPTVGLNQVTPPPPFDGFVNGGNAGPVTPRARQGPSDSAHVSPPSSVSNALQIGVAGLDTPAGTSANAVAR